MPIGVPRIIYCWGEELPAQWTDIYNFIFRRRMVFLMQYLDDELCNQICGLLINIHMEDRSKDLEKKEIERSGMFKSGSGKQSSKNVSLRQPPKGGQPQSEPRGEANFDKISGKKTNLSENSGLKQSTNFYNKKSRSMEDLLNADEDLGINEIDTLEQHTLQKITTEWLNWNAQFFDYSSGGEPYLFYLAELLSKDFQKNEAFSKTYFKHLKSETTQINSSFFTNEKSQLMGLVTPSGLRTPPTRSDSKKTNKFSEEQSYACPPSGGRRQKEILTLLKMCRFVSSLVKGSLGPAQGSQSNDRALPGAWNTSSDESKYSLNLNQHHQESPESFSQYRGSSLDDNGSLMFWGEKRLVVSQPTTYKRIKNSFFQKGLSVIYAPFRTHQSFNSDSLVNLKEVNLPEFKTSIFSKKNLLNKKEKIFQLFQSYQKQNLKTFSNTVNLMKLDEAKTSLNSQNGCPPKGGCQHILTSHHQAPYLTELKGPAHTDVSKISQKSFYAEFWPKANKNFKFDSAWSARPSGGETKLKGQSSTKSEVDSPKGLPPKGGPQQRVLAKGSVNPTKSLNQSISRFLFDLTQQNVTLAATKKTHFRQERISSTLSEQPQLAQKTSSESQKEWKNLIFEKNHSTTKKILSQRQLFSSYNLEKRHNQSLLNSFSSASYDSTSLNSLRDNLTGLRGDGTARGRGPRVGEPANNLNFSSDTFQESEFRDYYRQQTERALIDEESKKVFVIINSFGGSVGNGITVHDALQFIKAGSLTLGLGVAASAASLVLAGGTIGERYVTEGCHVMIHQPESSLQGQASDIWIDSQEIMKIRLDVAEIYSLSTYRPRHKILRDLDRDFYLTATETIQYGLADEIATNEVMHEIITMTNQVWDVHDQKQQRLMEKRAGVEKGGSDMSRNTETI